ncbi:hypothetical protein T11_14513 [Trichinella zimbabwensis]|uniref:Uncharacterized protein n=1 Tax=Trichinella zimbabwensis TaxID=268475 RepID=A0A0V1EML2_9BILA|nr:hypothetical protein T11_14513 [Trichinella zimbabwensis]
MGCRMFLTIVSCFMLFFQLKIERNSRIHTLCQPCIA